MTIQIERTSAHCEATDHETYRKLTRGGSSDALEVPFATMTSAFVAFACLGFHHGRYELIAKRQEIFLAISLDPHRHLPVLASLAFSRLRTEQPDAPTAELAAQLRSTRTIVPLVEGWASGGLRVFEEATESGSPHLTLALYDSILPAIAGRNAS